MTAAAALVDRLAPLRGDPAASAILLDVDGTLAPIVRHADDANVPETTRTLLIEVARRYGLVGCVTGRRAAEARRIVSIGSLAYIGNHGAELLRPGGTEPEIDQNLRPWTDRVQRFARSAASTELTRARVRLEDKQTIVAFHWRGAPDEDRARDAVQGVAQDAERAGFHVHWGRKVLEVRPPVPVDKGAGVRSLLRDAGLSAAMYAGDDATDLDAFRALRELVERGRLETAVLIGVTSEESPSEIASEADVTVEGTVGVHGVLRALLDDD